MVSYKFIGKIDYGSLGCVQKIQRRADGKKFVMKEINYESRSKDSTVNLTSFFTSLRSIHHPSILQCYDRTIDEDQKKLTIVMEYCAGGNLADLIESRRKSGKHFDEAFIWTVLGQVVSGIRKSFRFSAKHPEITTQYKDLMPGNILLDRKLNAKLFNFNLDPCFEVESTSSKRYMSFERQNGGNVDAKATVWALGCVIYEMATFRTPFNLQKVDLGKNSREVFGSFSPIPKCYSEELQQVCAWMLRQNEVRRPSIDSLSRLPQIQLTLREIRCNSLEKELRVRYEELKSNRMKLEHKVETKQKMLKSREDQLARVEYKLWLREQNIMKNNDYVETAIVSPSSSITRNSINFWRQEQSDAQLSSNNLIDVRNRSLNIQMAKETPIILANMRKRQSSGAAFNNLDNSVDSQWIYNETNRNSLHLKRQKI